MSPSPTTRHLFTHLPPELRNEIFAYLSTATCTPSTSNLPDKLTPFADAHTTIRIHPVHYGSDALLALQGYGLIEAREYASWVRENAVELQIGIVFKGRIGAFVLEDWAKRVGKYLAKFGKMYPWLAKVRKFDVRIKWDPSDAVLKSRKGRRVAGDVVRGIVETITGMGVKSEGLGEKRAKKDVSVKLCLARHVVLETVRLGVRLGFGDLFTGAQNGTGRQKWEVWIEDEKRNKEQEKVGWGFVTLGDEKQEDVGEMLRVEKGRVEWVDDDMGRCVLQNDSMDGGRIEVVQQKIEEKDGAGIGWVVAALIGECFT
ncbi:hypothetical protein FB567DRAFT_130864 [Paraphoma chrysanthemicola]|uniref:Uncharacterized protein n=1 Tax=Paraphoma chrysanthemicola TaxID=798071 RepID=A0A8K0VUR0_9PLEO|nr:hypothetical protein FB567DRAFT_130864 [Paraphoma chrysanthemicola]